MFALWQEEAGFPSCILCVCTYQPHHTALSLASGLRYTRKKQNRGVNHSVDFSGPESLGSLAYNHSRCHNRPGSAIHRHVVWPRCGPPATTVSGPGLSCKVIRQLVNLSLGDKFRPLVSIRASTFSSSKRCLGSHSLSYALIGWHRLQVGVGGRG